MDVVHTGLFIRGLIVLVTCCALVIAGALLARSAKRRFAKSAGDTPGLPVAAPTAIGSGPRYRADCGQLEANDSRASAPSVQRRAA